MEKILLKAEKRTETGKGHARSLRRRKMLPAVIYADGRSTPIELQRKRIVKLIASGVGEHALITIEFSNDKAKTVEHPVLVKDYQTDPVTNELLHVDFLEVSLEKKVKITIPIVIIVAPAGIKKGGILQHHVREVEVECLPTQIPNGIEVDAGHIDIGHSLHVSDLKSSEGIKILTDPHVVMLSVTAPVVEEVAPAAAAPVGEEAVEPELVKAKGKGEEEGKEERPQKEQKEK